MKQLFLALRTSPHYWKKNSFQNIDLITSYFAENNFGASRSFQDIDKTNILSSQICFPALPFIVFHLIPSDSSHMALQFLKCTLLPSLWASAHTVPLFSFFPDNPLHVCQVSHPKHPFSGKVFVKRLCNLVSKPEYFWELECYQKLRWTTKWATRIICAHTSSYRYIVVYHEGWKRLEKSAKKLSCLLKLKPPPPSLFL